MKAYRKTLSVLLKESRGAFLTMAERKRNGYARQKRSVWIVICGVD